MLLKSNRGHYWFTAIYEEKCVYAIKRRAGAETLLAVFNFSDKKQIYDLNVSDRAELLINTDWNIYGGNCRVRCLPETINGKMLLVLSTFSGILIVEKY